MQWASSLPALSSSESSRVASEVAERSFEVVFSHIPLKSHLSWYGLSSDTPRDDTANGL